MDVCLTNVTNYSGLCGTAQAKYRSQCPRRRRGWRLRSWRACSRGSGQRPVTRHTRRHKLRNSTGASESITHSAVAPALGHHFRDSRGGRGGHDWVREGGGEGSDAAGEGGGAANEDGTERTRQRARFYSGGHAGSPVEVDGGGGITEEPKLRKLGQDMVRAAPQAMDAECNSPLAALGRHLLSTSGTTLALISLRYACPCFLSITRPAALCYRVHPPLRMTSFSESRSQNVYSAMCLARSRGK